MNEETEAPLTLWQKTKRELAKLLGFVVGFFLVVLFVMFWVWVEGWAKP